MARLDDLLASNRAWSDRVNADDPEFFLRLSQQQAPKYLWTVVPTHAFQPTR